jgi:uncharacterized protein (UPF0261 family)
MVASAAIAVIGTFDSKAEEHRFLESRLKERGVEVLTINVGTKGPAPAPVSIDLFPEIVEKNKNAMAGRDNAISTMVKGASARVKRLHDEGRLSGLISPTFAPPSCAGCLWASRKSWCPQSLHGT